MIHLRKPEQCSTTLLLSSLSTMRTEAGGVHMNRMRLFFLRYHSKLRKRGDDMQGIVQSSVWTLSISRPKFFFIFFNERVSTFNVSYHVVLAWESAWQLLDTWQTPSVQPGEWLPEKVHTCMSHQPCHRGTIDYSEDDSEQDSEDDSEVDSAKTKSYRVVCRSGHSAFDFTWSESSRCHGGNFGRAQ